MFSYRLPSGGLRTKTYRTPDGQIKFDPPVYEQRYTTTIRIIEDPCWDTPLKKIVDFGCAEMRLLQLLRRIPFVEHILEVDVDIKLLNSNQQRAVPLMSDHLNKRKVPLRIEVLQGSVVDKVPQLIDVDVVIAIELIEHLHSDVLEQVPENIFGFIQPKLAIFTTPNSDFNILFGPLLQNGFRHLDHKFEWSRAEFKSWADNICERYPNYSVSFMGLGKAPTPAEKKLGHASQMAIFARNDIIGRTLNEDIKPKIIPEDSEAKYNLVYAVDFPHDIDNRTKEQKILEEARYYINQSRNISRFFNRERCIYQIPWLPLMEYASSVNGTEDDLLGILKANDIEVENDFIIMPEEDDDDDDEFMLDYDGEYNLDAEPYRGDLDSNDSLVEMTADCNLNSNKPNDESEEDWD